MINSSIHEYCRHVTLRRLATWSLGASLLNSFADARRLCSCFADLNMAPKRGRPLAAAKGKAPLQQQLEQLQLIKKPLEIIGEYVNVPGTFWIGRMSAAEKEALYSCIVRDFSVLHKFLDGPTSQAFEVQEMGTKGTGSLEGRGAQYGGGRRSEGRGA